MPVKKMSFAKILIPLLFLITLLASGCKKQDISGKGFRFPLLSEPRQIDPQVATDSGSITLIATLFEGLARLDESGTPQPAAASWTVSNDGLTYTFTLKSSKWSDGSELTADDFVFGWQRAVMPSTNSQYAESLFIIKNAREINQGKKNESELGVKAADSKTLVVTLTQPDSDFPAKTATPPFMPCKKSFFEETGGRYGLEAKYVLSNGPFYLKAWTHNESLLLYKHDGYHDAQNILPSAVRYVLGSVDNPVSYLEEVLLDAAQIPASAVKDAEEKGITVLTHQDSIRMLWMNNSIPALSNANIRRALRDAIEWEKLYEQFDKNTDIPATGFIPPDSITGTGEKYRSSVNPLTPTTKAQEASKNLDRGLESAGLDKMPSLTLICPNDEYSINIARYIVQSWQKNLSLYFNIESLSPSQLDARFKVGNYQLALYTYTPQDSKAVDVLTAFKSGSVGNYSRFSDSGFDSKLSSIKKNPSKSEVANLEKALWDFCPSVPVSFELTFFGIPKGNSGISIMPFGGGTFGSLYDFRKAGKIEK